ncbi:alpha/beta hydrolase [Polaribacter litorisediminis]|uniref:alpha/beta hydrolase n=1 Tax=Polaribacter litorisediminis TaxID=1908341 RepID=UPI001CBC9BBE|nr:alpha/beta hydrolase [Polaribacter litorisediminis]UAM99789.1 alpha/beta hydrolase [Polaribacter litorisediminis]
MQISDWKENHITIKLLNEEFSYIDTLSQKPVILVIHGYGSSSYDFHKVLGDLKESYRVLMPDLIGFGFSSKPKNYYFSIVEQAQILIKLIDTLKIQEFSVICQGFGASVLCEILSLIQIKSVEIEIHKIWFLNLSLSIELSMDIEKQRAIENFITTTFLKISSTFGIYKKYTKDSFFNPDAITEEELKTGWELLNYNNGLKTLDFVKYWIIEINHCTTRWLKVLSETTSTIDIIWGLNDILKDYETPERIQFFLKTTQQMHLIDKCGYFIALEKPKEFMAFILNDELKK